MRTSAWSAEWTDTEIEHHAYKMKNNCVIMIPVYKGKLTDEEQESLKQSVTVFGKKYEIVLVCPYNLDATYYNNIANYDFSILRCSNGYFKSQRSYSDLCEEYKFYEAFREYDYMIIYQLDAWVFEDKVEYFIDLGYDYIGAPHLCGWGGNNNEGECGNGGFCLRRIGAFYKCCKENNFTKIDNLEDCAFCKNFKNYFKLAPVDVCRKFSFQEKPEFQYKMNNNELPMGCHAHYRCNLSFWRGIGVTFNSKNIDKMDLTVNVINRVYSMGSNRNIINRKKLIRKM